MTLENQGILNAEENRKIDARKAFQEAPDIYQQFAKKSPERYGREVGRIKSILEMLNH
jgi:hypothetical protein